MAIPPWEPLIDLLEGKSADQAEEKLRQFANSSDQFAEAIAVVLESADDPVRLRVLRAVGGQISNPVVRSAIAKVLTAPGDPFGSPTEPYSTAIGLLRPFRDQPEVQAAVLGAMSAGLSAAVTELAFEVLYGDLDQRLAGDPSPDRVELAGEPPRPERRLVPSEDDRRTSRGLFDDLLRHLRTLEDSAELDAKYKAVIAEAIVMIGELRALLGESVETEAELGMLRRFGRRLTSGSRMLIESTRWGVPVTANAPAAWDNVTAAASAAFDFVEPFLS